MKKNGEVMNSPRLGGVTGVIIVSYCSGNVLLECIETLLSSTDSELRIVVVDNASPDDTVSRLHSWAAGKFVPEQYDENQLPQYTPVTKPVDVAEHPAENSENIKSDQFASVTILRAARNVGFAGGVNIGISALRAHSDISLFWILNPDCMVLPDTAAAFRDCADKAGRFGLMGGRLIYSGPPNLLQSDGGSVNHWTGVCSNINQGCLPNSTEPPRPSSLDFVSGANVVASREFIDEVGLMVEDYFLYYEEVDWAARRGDLPIILCPEAVVYHHGGTVIGTGSVSRRPSAFANYFNFRNRMMYMWRFQRLRIPAAMLFSLAKICQLLLHQAWDEAIGAIRGLFLMSPPRKVADKISVDSYELAFHRKPGPK